ncbi:hypothetical protein O0L34_g6872 [Tuta absoluta]|nr:hypothetical protein O0L34_g6872 [Tuta absoluta]
MSIAQQKSKSKTDITDDAINAYKETLKKTAETLLVKEFPSKIVHLNELLEKSFKNLHLSDVHQDLNIPMPEWQEPRPKRRRLIDSSHMFMPLECTQVYTLPNGPSPCNRHLSCLINTVKPHFRQLVEDTNTLKMWTACLIPKMEDGNNFGVSILEMTHTAIHRTEQKAHMFLVRISEYFMKRAEMLTKVVKYPHIEDYRRAVRELDESEYITLRFDMNEVKNLYCQLHDIVTKNLEKIKSPRTSNIESLY